METFWKVRQVPNYRFSTEANIETNNLDGTTCEHVIMIQQTAETQEIGVGTLESLERSRHQIQEAQLVNKNIQTSLEETERLQNRLDRWAFRFGRKKPAQRLAKQTIEYEKELRTIRNASKLPQKELQDDEPPSVKKKSTKRDKSSRGCRSVLEDGSNELDKDRVKIKMAGE